MPEKSLTVATYAAGASLAAITLIYVFGPTYFLDNSPPAASGVIASLSNRKKGVIGLANPANDCFINSVLQALAGLGDLRLYLIREMHRRSLDESWVYAKAIPPEARGGGDIEARAVVPDWKVEGLQSGIVTQGLKDILDSLNERPIYKKTISAAPFVRSLEQAFRQRISRQQQDAQEFLQVVAERLCDEYHAGRRARTYARRKTEPFDPTGMADTAESRVIGSKPVSIGQIHLGANGNAGLDAPKSVDSEILDRDDEDEAGFPMEGKFESQIECQTCGFKPKPTESTFCTLTLNVPQTSSTSLNDCFDGMFKTEYIDDFKCEKCRLVHAISVYGADLDRAPSESSKAQARAAISSLQRAIETDPEKPPPDVVLPDIRSAPKRRIARHIRLTRFPKIMAIHLSRSIYDSNQSQKNSAKVSFPERLPLGGLLQQRKYKLLGTVTHKGSHYSGHYESFRRQNLYPPFSNPNTFLASGAYSKPTSPATTPRIDVLQQNSAETSPLESTADLLAPASLPQKPSTPPIDTVSTVSPSHRNSPSLNGISSSPSPRRGPTSAPREKPDLAETSSLRSVAVSARSTLSRITSRPSSRNEAINGSGRGTPIPSGAPNSVELPAQQSSAHPVINAKSKRRKDSDRWWRISDEKIKEATTRDVLGMEREIYLLFYELEKESV